MNQISVGDRVQHAGRPEWGVGTVEASAPDTHEGRPCQRLTIRFEREGRKTISTAFAELRNVSSMEDPPEDPTQLLTRLPEAATDPFRSLEDRCATTIDLYRFEPTGRGLVDWAAMQTGLADPLSRFARHELEDRFARFRSALDAHLTDLVRELRRADIETLRRLARAAPRDAQTALRRAVAR